MTGKKFDLLEVYYKWKYRPEYQSKSFGISRLGLCERGTILKKAHAPEIKRTLDEKQKLDIKFDMADYCESDIADSWFDRGVLISRQLWVTKGLPTNWNGKLDAWVDRPDIGFEVIEIKASHPNMFTLFNIDLPKHHNVLQCLGYIYALNNWFMGLQPYGNLGVKNFMFTHGRIVYMNRGGESKPLQFPFKFAKDDRDLLIDMMTKIDKHWDAYNKTIKAPLEERTLPEMLDKQVAIRKKKKKKGNETITVLEAILEPFWECGWCDFCNISCNPDLSKNKCGEFDDKGNFTVRKGYEQFKTLAIDAKEKYDKMLKRPKT